MPVHRSLQEAAGRWPGHEALRWRDSSWSYERLATAATGVAGALTSAGVEAGERVAIHLWKRPEAVASLYGILQAGAAFVPLDPAAPAAYVQSTATACGVSALVVDDEFLPAWTAWLRRTPLRVVIAAGTGTSRRAFPPSISFEEAAQALAPASVVVAETDIACVIPTSGSTGTPKGVVHRHRALSEVARWTADRLQLGPDDRVGVHPPLHFVLSAYGLFPAALVGATCVLVPEERSVLGRELLRAIQDERITAWVSAPSALSLLGPVASGSRPAGSLRAVVFTGEPVPPAALAAVRGLSAWARVWSLYGTTEAWGIAYREIDQVPDPRPLSLGMAWEGVEIVVIREDGSPAAVGEEGELLASSAKLMAGYWGDPVRTAAALGPDPTGTRPGLFYRTGDLVRLLPGGEFEWTGRRDHQVARRGHRLDLTEIEETLGGHPAITTVAVVALPHPTRGVWITAVAAVRPDHVADPEDLMAFLAERLPGRLLPDRVEVADHLPVTSGGKVDRAAVARRVRSRPQP